MEKEFFHELIERISRSRHTMILFLILDRWEINIQLVNLL